MPTRETYFNPVVKMITNIDTGEITIEIDFGSSMDKGTAHYESTPDECERDGDYLDRVLSIQGLFIPTTVGGIIRLLPGELTSPVNLEDLPPPPPGRR